MPRPPPRHHRPLNVTRATTTAAPANAAAVGLPFQTPPGRTPRQRLEHHHLQPQRQGQVALEEIDTAEPVTELNGDTEEDEDGVGEGDDDEEGEGEEGLEEEDDDEDEGEEIGGVEADIEDMEEDAETDTVENHPALDMSTLKEIGNLASWTVSTAKPGCGVDALRSEDTNLFWQSDGPQPHLLNIHFSRLVAISHIRLYLDFPSDESYTPTKLSFLAGTSPHDLQEFAELLFAEPRGWINVDLSGVGGRASTAGVDGAAAMGFGSDSEEGTEADGRVARADVLRAHLVQVQVKENHQNGKDTHIRGLQVFARTDNVAAGWTRRRKQPLVNDDTLSIAAAGVDVDMEDDLEISNHSRTKRTAGKARAGRGRHRRDEDDDWGFDIGGDVQLR
ncbi:MAG: GABA-specific high-affinity permease [Chaenotheca gracillima]|nr:MAG: GABA-specific high-affinity permease [Chaenotheca gracillima]